MRTIPLAALPLLLVAGCAQPAPSAGEPGANATAPERGNTQLPQNSNPAGAAAPADNGSAPLPVNVTGASNTSQAASPCLVQGSERLRVGPLRAVGTEPFWGARVEGRCVTYSHPEDQQGSRIWTRFTPGPGGGVWVGALGGRPFEMRVRPQPGCSDGMSDREYPLAVDLLVNGERRTGCAYPG
jgi:uncharacterized membrane protein